MRYKWSISDSMEQIRMIGIFCHMKFRFVQKNNFEIQSRARMHSTDTWLIQLPSLLWLRFCVRVQFDKQELSRVYAITLYMGTVCN